MDEHLHNKDYFDESSESDEGDVEPQPVSFRLPIPTNMIIDEKLPIQSENEHAMFRKQFNNYNRSLDYFSETHLRHVAQQVDRPPDQELEEENDEEEEGHTLTYSAVIMRDYSLSQVLDVMRDARKTADMFEARDMVFSTIELANFLNELLNINPDVADRSNIVRELVDTSYE